MCIQYTCRWRHRYFLGRVSRDAGRDTAVRQTQRAARADRGGARRCSATKRMDHGHLSSAQARSAFVLAPSVDEAVRAEAYRRLDRLTKPRGALGRLEPLAAQMCAIQGTLGIRVIQPTGIVFAADHGVAESGVSAYPREVTVQMVANFLQGGAAISVLAKLQGIELWIVDAGVDGDCGAHPRLIDAKIRRGTRNFVEQPAMTAEECADALQWGLEVVERVMPGDSNALVLGEM